MPDLQDLSKLDLSSVFDVISKNPDLLNVAKDVMASLQKGDLADAAEKESTPSDPESTTEVSGMLDSLLPSASHAKKKDGGKNGNRDALLCALRPYLSPERQSALDKLLRIEQLAALLSQLDGKAFQK